MKNFILVLVVIALAAPSFASISIKGGLAGGAFCAGAVIDRQIRDNLVITGDLGYGLGNGYNLALAGVGLRSKINDIYYFGAAVAYSSYSSVVRLGLPAVDITEKSGVGAGVYVGMTRDKLFLQAGYDNRLGALVEAGLVVRM